MMTFDQSLYNLYQSGKVSKEVALDNADSRNNLSIRINLEQGVELGKETSGLDFDRDDSDSEWRKD